MERAVPAAAFGLVLVVQADRLRRAVATASGPSASPADRLAALDVALLIAFYALLVVVYLVRLPPRDGDRRPGIALASFAGSFLVMIVPLVPAAPRRDWLLMPADLLTLAGITCTIWSLLWLRRSFSILPQARRLVTGGPYRLSRNPLYMGEIVSSWAVFLPTIAWPGVLVLAVNLALQLVRVRAEERVLARTFGPEYAAYRERVPRFVPWPRRPHGLVNAS